MRSRHVPDKTDWVRRYTQEDCGAATLRTALSLAGPVGAIVAEFLTQFVPGQRIDRLNDFVEQLGQRVADVEEQFKVRLHESAAFASLAEQVSLAAVRSPSAERRCDLAELLRHGLSRPDAELIEEHAVVRLLDQLNDAQVLILMQHGSFTDSMVDPARDEFVERNADILAVMPPGYGDPEEQHRRWTMYRHYEDGLIGLNLLEDAEGIVKGGPVRRVRITALGCLLLTAIGRAAE
jgi:hypothetical protein